jgi:hypothetical protein
MVIEVELVWVSVVRVVCEVVVCVFEDVLVVVVRVVKGVQVV